MKRTIILLACVSGLACALVRAEQPASDQGPERPAPKPLSAEVNKGVAWLAAHQLEAGGWGQGEESQRMKGGEALRDQPNVADTCMAALALIRAGHTPRAGEHGQAVGRAVLFVCREIEASDEPSLFITDLRDTRTQSKLGTYIDTFLAAQLLAEVKGQIASAAETARVEAALAKVVKKIEANQREDGQWVNQGWATVLAQAQAAKALNQAAVAGAGVDETKRMRAETFARAEFRSAGEAGGSVAEAGAIRGAAARPAGDAGVRLYSAGAEIAAMEASHQANEMRRAELGKVLADADAEEEDKQQAREMLARFADNESDLREAQLQVVDRLNDERFIAGFGTNGGEEFLSYLNIGESLFAKGGEEWRQWDEKISASLHRAQNDDGSWTGHHCITGRTFCTAAALMVLTIDRAPLAAASRTNEARGQGWR